MPVMSVRSGRFAKVFLLPYSVHMQNKPLRRVYNLRLQFIHTFILMLRAGLYIYIYVTTQPVPYITLSPAWSQCTNEFSLWIKLAWWRHQMGPFSALLALCAGNSPVPVKSPLNGQWRGALMFPLICVWINGWVNNREAGDLRRHRAHYGVIVMQILFWEMLRICII